MAMDQPQIWASQVSGHAPRKWNTGANCIIAIMRPRISGAVVNCIRELDTGQKPPMLVEPTMATRMHPAQNHGVQAITNQAHAAQVTSQVHQQPLRFRSPQLATTIDPRNAAPTCPSPGLRAVQLEKFLVKPTTTCM